MNEPARKEPPKSVPVEAWDAATFEQRTTIIARWAQASAGAIQCKCASCVERRARSA